MKTGGLQKTDYDIRMIAMSNHPVSLMYQRLTIPSWEKHGYEIKLFEAVTPKDLYKKHKLDFGIKNNDPSRARQFTLTEIAVWYSHFELWCESVRTSRSMIVIEHDSLLKKKLPVDLTKDTYKLLSYINRDFGDKVRSISPGSGYFISPLIASRLVSRAVCHTIETNSDGFIMGQINFQRQVRRNDYHYIEQINIDGLNTIDHKNPDRNYVGLDYEEIDISSIHGQKI